MLTILSERFAVPELNHVSGYVNICRHVTGNCGLKRNFGFVYHQEGLPQNPREVYQVVIPDAFDGPEAHYFRQDIDQYLTQVAVRYGATLRESTHVTDIQIDSAGVVVETKQGDRFEAQFIVDASGYRSVLAAKYGLRDVPCRFKTNSRSIFTHMVDVPPYEDIVPGAHDVPRRWSQGTLHHCFNSGWLWVIPFNNGPVKDNPLISVGLQLHGGMFPNRNLPPEEEFRDFLTRYPSMAKQFASAKAVRNWTSTGDRMQYSSRRTIGPRFCLTAHAAGALGPLYSRGMALTMNAILPLAEELLGAARDGDFSEGRFERVDQLQQRALDNIDALVAGSYTAWRDFDLWNAWVRVWYASTNLGYYHMAAVHTRYRTSGDHAVLRDLQLPHTGSFCPSLDEYQRFFTSAVAIIDAVEAGALEPKRAAGQLFTLLERADFIPPVFLLDRPEATHGGKFDFDHIKRLVEWGNRAAPAQVKERLFPGPAQQNLEGFSRDYEEFLRTPHLAEIRPFLEATALR
jgi:FADH2 O2-dependent halogenase